MATFGDYATHLALCNVAIAIAMEDTAYDFSRVFDLGRVAQSLMLVAHDDGVGSCVAVFEPHANVARANELLGVPERFSIDVAIGFGYRSSRQPERLGQVPVGRHPLSRIYFEEVFGRSPGRG
jgi:nitroreductase